MFTPEQIDQWRAADSETEHLEFKEAKNQYSFENLVEYCVAIANERGGILLLGVSDKPPRSVVGSNAFPNITKVREDLFSRLRFRVEVEEVKHPGGRVVVFTIPPRPPGHPYNIGGKYLMRAGSSIVAMTPDHLKRIIAEVVEPRDSQKRSEERSVALMALAIMAAFLIAIATLMVLKTPKAPRPAETSNQRIKEPKLTSPQSPNGSVYPDSSDPPKTEERPALSRQFSESPPFHRVESFTTFVVINPQNPASPVVPSTDLLKNSIYSQFQEVVKSKMPESGDAVGPYLGRAMQHFLIVLVNYAESGFALHAGTNKIMLKTIPAIDVPNATDYELDELLKNNKSDALLDYVLGSAKRIRFPHSTTLTLASTSASKIGPEAHSLRLERSGYYRLDISVSLLMAGAKGQLPDKFNTKYYDTSLVETYYYTIRSEIFVRRNSDFTFAPDDYLRWGQQLFESIKGKLEQPAELPEIQ